MSLVGNPVNSAYENDRIKEGMRSLSSIMNPSASQNASYQLERKRFLEGNAQEQRNKANQAFATSDSGKRILSEIMGYAEDAGVDLGPLLGKVSWDPNFQQSTAGVRNLSTGKQRQGAYEIMTAPETLPGLPGPDDTQRIGAATAYTNKYMGRDDVISAPMKNTMLETEEELEKTRIANNLTLGTDRILMDERLGEGKLTLEEKLGLAKIASDQKVGLAGVASTERVGLGNNTLQRELGGLEIESSERIANVEIASGEKVALNANEIAKVVGLDKNSVQKAVGLDKNIKVYEIAKLASQVEEKVGLDSNKVLETVGLDWNKVRKILGEDKNARWEDVEKGRIASEEKVALNYNQIRRELGLDENAIDKAVRLDANVVQKAVGLNKNLTLVEIAKLAEETAFKLGIDKNKVLEKIGLDENQITKLIGQDKNLKWSEVEKIRAENENQTRLKDIIVGKEIGMDKNDKWREVQLDKNANDKEIDELIATNAKEVGMAEVQVKKEVGLDQNVKDANAYRYRWDVNAKTEKWLHNNREITLKALPGQRLVVDEPTGKKLGITPDEDGLYVFEAGPDPSKPYKVVVGEGQIAYINEQTALELGVTKNEDGTYSIPGSRKYIPLSQRVAILKGDKGEAAFMEGTDEYGNLSLEQLASTEPAVGDEIIQHDVSKDLLSLGPSGEVKVLREGRLSKVLSPGQTFHSILPSNPSTSDITLSNRLPEPEPLAQNVKEEKEKKVKLPKTLGTAKDFNLDWNDRVAAFSEGAMEKLPAAVKQELKARTQEIFEQNYRNPEDPEAYGMSFNAAFEEVFGGGNPVHIDPIGWGDVTVPGKIYSNMKAAHRRGVNEGVDLKKLRAIFAKRLRSYKYDNEQIKTILDDIF